MVKSLRTRLVGGYLLVVAIFAVFGSVAFWNMVAVNRSTERFIDHYWRTADVIMDLRNTINEIFITTLTHPPGLDPETFVWESRQTLIDFRNALPRTMLEADRVSELQRHLLALERVLPEPLQLEDLPTFRMREADAVAEKLLRRAEKTGDPELVHLVHRATMTFNDVLSTHDVAELRTFQSLLQRIETHPRRPLLGPALAEFRRAGRDVFAAEQQLRSANERFGQVRRDLQAALQEVEQNFASRVVNPEEQRVLELIRNALLTLASVLSLGVFCALLAGSLVARSISRPLERTIAMVRDLGEGNLARRLHLGRRDEIGRMADSLDNFADTLQSALVALTGTIASQRGTARQLQESERKYRTLAEEFKVLLEGIPDSLALLGPDRRVLWANGAAARQAGRPPEDLLGVTCSELTGAPAAVPGECVVERCFRDGEPVDDKVPLKDGRILGIKAFPLGHGPRGVDRVIRLSSDITERTRLQDEAVRTNRLAALGELSAGVAHEINNPNALALYNVPVLLECFRALDPIIEAHYRAEGDFVLAGLSCPEFREEVPAMLREVLEGAQRIQRIVEDLKNFVREGEPENRQPFDLNEAVMVAVRLSSNALRGATDHFSTQLADPLPPCAGVPQKIEQVIINLLQNACQSLPERERAITVSTGFDSADGMNLVVVRDEGRGIDEKDLDRLTDPFFTTRRTEGGTGLGLSISARIVQDHDGRLEFDSAPGEGTTVRLYLPTWNSMNKGGER